MPRRISLALALAFTTVVTFALIAIGAQAGVFSESKPSDVDAAVEEAPVEVAAAPVAPTEAPVIVQPQVIVETEYIDVIDPAPPAAAVPTDPTAGGAANEMLTAADAAETPAATKTPRATATAVAAASATAVPPKATSTASTLPREIEFVGSVTAIDGDQVTFSHGGTLTRVKVPDPGALEVGDTAHVHALLKPSGYVATEVSVGG